MAPSEEERSDIPVVTRPVDLRQNNAHVCARGTERDGGGEGFSCNGDSTDMGIDFMWDTGDAESLTAFYSIVF